MRARALIWVLLFVLIVSGAAAWADGPQTKSNSPTYDLFQQPAPGERTFPAPSITVRQFKVPKSESRLADLSAEQVRRLLMNPQSGCYTMRTYIVAREDNSDSTRSVGYQECLPSSRVRMKNVPAEQHRNAVEFSPER